MLSSLQRNHTHWNENCYVFHPLPPFIYTHVHVRVSGMTTNICRYWGRNKTELWCSNILCAHRHSYIYNVYGICAVGKRERDHVYGCFCYVYRVRWYRHQILLSRDGGDILRIRNCCNACKTIQTFTTVKETDLANKQCDHNCAKFCHFVTNICRLWQFSIWQISNLPNSFFSTDLAKIIRTIFPDPFGSLFALYNEMFPPPQKKDFTILYQIYSFLLAQAEWPDWAIYLTLGNFLKPLATINLPKSPKFLGNFCSEIIFVVKSF